MEFLTDTKDGILMAIWNLQSVPRWDLVVEYAIIAAMVCFLMNWMFNRRL
jgi:hypothetical protein